MKESIATKLFNEVRDHLLFVEMDIGTFEVTVSTSDSHTHIFYKDKSLEEILREALAWLNKQEEEK